MRNIRITADSSANVLQLAGMAFAAAPLKIIASDKEFVDDAALDVGGMALRSNGRMAAVVPHGVLFRGSAEGRIRQIVIEKNLLDAVIGLPANLFYGIPSPRPSST